jgi:electron transport complex protein RnfB
MTLANELDQLLPQTQCGECGYPGCLPYAQAMAAKSAPIDRCPPGGIETLKKLGQHLHIDPTPYFADKARLSRAPSLAVIREVECIGCTKCIQACPVDAIIGSAKHMHSVLAHECTGCGLCVSPCPVDCIDIIPQEQATYDHNLARSRFQAKKVRTLREEHEKAQSYREKRRMTPKNDAHQHDKQAKMDYILEALARVKTKGKP